MFKQFAKCQKAYSKQNNFTDINQFLFWLSTQIKEANYVNKNIDKIIKTDQYNIGFKKSIENPKPLNIIGLLNGLGAISHIIDHLGFDNQEQKLRDILISKTDLLLNQPISIICDTYYNLTLLRCDSQQFRVKIFNYIKEENGIPENSFIKIQRAINKNVKLENDDYKLIKTLDSLNITNYQPLIKARIFRQYAEYYPLYKEPFYNIPKQMIDISKTLKTVQSQSILDIFCGYYHIGNQFEIDFFKTIQQQFDNQIKDELGLILNTKFFQIINILKILNKLTFLEDSFNLNFKWKLYLNSFFNQFEKNPIQDPKVILGFCTVFQNKLHYLTEMQKQIIWNLIKQQVIQYPSIWDFMCTNKNEFNPQIFEEFKKLFEEQNSKLQNYAEYNQFAKLLNLPSRQPEIYSKIGLMLLNYSNLNDEEINLKFIKNIKIRQALWGCQFKVIFTSINGEQSSQFWKQQTIKYQEQIIQEYKTELERQLNNDYYMYPKIFNYYQLEFIIWTLEIFNIQLMLVSIQFYRNVIKYQDLIDRVVTHIIQSDLSFQQVGYIWQQMNFNNNSNLIQFLKQKASILNQKEINNNEFEAILYYLNKTNQ